MTARECMSDDGLSSPDSKAGRLQRVLLKMLRDRVGQPDALPTSIRFLYYELVQQSIVAKHKRESRGRRSDQDMSEASLKLRETGLVPWNWIADETRSLSSWRYSTSVLGYLYNTLDSARIDLWGGEEPPFFLTESRSLSGVLSNLTYKYLAPIAATNGQCRGFLHTDVAPALSPGRRVAYLGDWDLAGNQCEDNTRKVLERLIGGELDWKRLAITEQQVRDHNLPVIIKYDRRYKDGRPHEAVETEALGQTFIVNLVRQYLDALLPEPLDDVLERERRQRAQMRATLVRLARRRSS